MSLTALALVAVLAAAPSRCSCIGPVGTTAELLSGADAVFIGRVVAIRPAAGRFHVELQVDRAWRWPAGGARPPRVITVETAEGTMCGAYFASRETWLVVAHRDEGNALPSTGQCTGTDRLGPPTAPSSDAGGARVRALVRAIERQAGPGVRPQR